MTSEIIAIEDWVLPDGTRPAARSRDDDLRKRAAAIARLSDPNAPRIGHALLPRPNGPFDLNREPRN
jgi:hypothetical protein